MRVGNNFNSFEAAQKEWLKYHVFMKTAQSMPEALKLLSKKNYNLVVIIADSIEYLPFLKLMRDMKPMPILVLSTNYNAYERLAKKCVFLLSDICAVYFTVHSLSIKIT